MSLRRTGLFLLLAFTPCLAPAQAHSTNGSSIRDGQSASMLLSGHVTGADGKPLVGAAVKLENESTHQVSSRLTDRDGHYEFRRLPGTADFRVWASFHRHNSSDKRVDHLDDNPRPVVDLTIAS